MSDKYCFNEDEILQLFNEEKNILQILKEPSDDLLKKMISRRPHFIKYIEHPSEELQTIFLDSKNNCEHLCYIKNPNRKVIMDACKKCPRNIKHVYDLTEEEKKEIVKSNPHAISEIENPSLDLLLNIPSKGGYYSFVKGLDHLSKEEQLILLDKNPIYIDKIKNKSEDVLIWAIKKGAVQYVKDVNTTPKVREEAIKINGWSLNYINDLTENEFIQCWRDIIFRQEHNAMLEKILTKPWVYQVVNSLEKQFFHKKLSMLGKRELGYMIKDYRKYGRITS